MIGVVCENSEMDVVREFFELFKTPWEFYVEGRPYDVIVSTLGDLPNCNATVLVIYSSNKVHLDSVEGVVVGSQHSNVFVNNNGVKLPIYGSILSFEGVEHFLLSIMHNSEAAGFEIGSAQRKILRVGYDLFKEVAFLLSKGQPIENANIPTLEIHISMLRTWIVNAGIPLVEVPPVPAGYNFIAGLTHDVDFVRIGNHKFDHTMWGFIYRASFGSLSSVLKGRLSLGQLLRNLRAVFCLPLVFLGICKDFWFQFDRYREIEKDLKSTFFLIPFANKPGEKVSSPAAHRRAAKYDISDVAETARHLTSLGYEVGVHGIDAWHNDKAGEQELRRISEVVGKSKVGIRMHWLCINESSPKILEKAGYDYDSTFGYNKAVGYRAGTTQVYRPPGAMNLLELPLHVQDAALFSPGRLYLTEEEAWKLCEVMFNNVSTYGGVLTILWHLRSLAPERLWDDYYARLLEGLKTRGAWITSAGQVVEWFRKRRALSFLNVCFTGNKLRLSLKYDGNAGDTHLMLRVHLPVRGANAEGDTIDIPLTGDKELEIAI